MESAFLTAKPVEAVALAAPAPVDARSGESAAAPATAASTSPKRVAGSSARASPAGRLRAGVKEDRAEAADIRLLARAASVDRRKLHASRKL
jgi:hypothetical protein